MENMQENLKNNLPEWTADVKQLTALVHVSHVAKSFEGRAVLRDVHCELPAGQIVALVGANGAGKTTLLRCLAGVMRPDHGRIVVTRSVRAQTPATRVAPLARRVLDTLRSLKTRQPGVAEIPLAAGCRNGCPIKSHSATVDRRLVGFVSHENQLYPQLTMRENLVFAARMYGLKQPVAHIHKWLRSWDLLHAADRLPGRLSQGTRQRFAVARALVHDPLIVLWDEPFAGLDQQGQRWLVELLHELRRRDRVILFASHDPSLVQRHADRVLELCEGVVLKRAATQGEVISGMTRKVAA